MQNEHVKAWAAHVVAKTYSRPVEPVAVLSKRDADLIACYIENYRNGAYCNDHALRTAA